MKKILLSILLSACAGIYAQNLDYILTHSTSTYADLSSPTDVTNNAWGSEHLMTLPFTFKYFDTEYDTIHIAAVSGIYFSNISGSVDVIFFGTETYYPENNNPALSPVSYLVSGVAPNRILKIEFQNFYAMTSPGEDFIVDNQIWLYETSNKIEYHFGPSLITDPIADEFYIGFIDYDNSPYYAIDSTAANPVLVRVTSAGTFNGIKTHPVDGQVYTLTPKNTSSVNKLVKPYKFNHVMNGFQFNNEKEAMIGVYDLSGKLVETVPYFPGQLLQHEFTNIAPGIYMVNICMDNLQFIEKIIIR